MRRRHAAADAPPAPRRRWIRALIPPALLLVVAFAVFPSGGSDDSYITYWAAYSLAETGEILNYNGDRLEQSSSLLHTVVLAAGARLTGLSVPAVGHLVAPAAGIATVVATMALARRIRPDARFIAGMVAATSAYLLFWTFGGLETTLATAVVAGAVLACARVAGAAPPQRRDWGWAVVAIGAAVVVRPESALVLGATLLGATVLEVWFTRGRPAYDGRRAGARRLVVLLGILVVAFGLAVAARQVYFGASFPNPVSAKTGDLVAAEGWRYVQTWWVSRFHVPVLLVAAAGTYVALRHARDSTPALVTCALAAVTGFVLTSGGDWMQGGRFFVPAVPYVATLAAVAVTAVPRRRIAALALLAVQVLGVLSFADHRSTATPMWADADFTPSRDVQETFGWFELRNRVHARNAELYVLAEDVVGRLVRTGDGPVTVAGAQAGLTIFRLVQEFGDDVVFIDRYNLVTDAFGACDDLLAPSFRGLGREMTYAQWLPNTEVCGVPAPDVVIEYDTIAQQPALDGRYTQVASVPFIANRAEGPLQGIVVTTAQFVAVRNDLLARVGD